MDFLDIYILGIGDPQELFHRLFASSSSEAKSNKLFRGLIGNSDAVAYMESRQTQISHFFHYGKTEKDEEVQSQEQIQKRIYNKISQDIVSAVENGTVDYKQGTIIEKFMTKILDYDSSDVSAPEPPRIYLPESCSHCRYRIAIEENDDTIDECEHCRYKKDSIARGVEYDYKSQLV